MLFSNTPDKALKKAREFSDKGRIDKAIERLDKATLEFPKSFEILWELVMLYRKVENIEEINKQLKKVLQVFPEKKDVVLKFLEDNFFELPFNKEMASLLAQLYLATRDLAATNNVLKRFPERSLDEEISEQTKKMEQMEGSFKDSHMPYSYKFISLLYYLALLNKKAGHDDEYMELLTRIGKISGEEVDHIISELKRSLYADKQNINYRLALAKIHLSLKMPKDAIEEMMVILQIKPQLGKTLLELLEAALEETKDDPNLLLGYGQIAMMAGRPDIAMPTLKNLVQNQPHIGPQVVEKFRLRLRSDPQNPIYRLALAEIYIHMGQATNAIQEIEIAHNQAPDQNDKLIPVLNELLKLDPENSSAMFMLADAYLSSGKTQESVKLFIQSIQRDPTQEESIISKLTYLLEVQPENFPIRLALSQLYVSLEQTELAQHLLSEIPSKVPQIFLQDLIVIYQNIVKTGTSSRSIMINLAQLLLNNEQYQELPTVLLAMDRKFPDEIPAFLRQVVQIIPQKPQIMSSFRPFLEKYYEKNTGNEVVQSLLLQDYSEQRDYERIVNFIEALSLQSTGVPESIFMFLEDLILQKGVDNAPLRLMWVRLAIDRNQIEKVLNLYKKLEKETPGYFELAKEILNLVLHKDPANEEAQISLLKLYFQNEIYEVCIDTGLNILSRKEISEVRSLVALCEAKEGKWDKALASIKLLPDSFTGDKIKILEEIEKKNPSQIDVVTELAKSMAAANQLDNAVEKLLAFIDLQPVSAPLLKEFADSLFANNPHNGRLYFLKGKFFMLENKTKEAIEHLQKAIDLETSISPRVLPLLINMSQNIKGDHQIQLNMAMLHIRDKDYDKAVTALREAFRISPQIVNQVMQKLMEIIDNVPDNIPANYLLYDLSLAMDQPDTAVQALEKISKKDLSEEGKTIFKSFVELEKRFKDNKLILRAFIRLLLSLSRWDDAIEKIKNLLILDSNEVLNFRKEIFDLQSFMTSYVPNLAFCKFILAFKERNYSEIATLSVPLYEENEFKDIVYEKLIELYKTDTKFNLNLVISIAKLDIRREQFKQAEEILLDALKNTKGDEESEKKVKIELVSLYRSTNRNKEALELLPDLEESDPQVYKSIYQSVTDGMKAKVLEMKERLAKETGQQSYETRIELAKILLALNRPKEALNYLQTSGWLFDKQKERLLYSAQAYIRMGDHLEAVSLLRSFYPKEQNLDPILESDKPLLKTLSQAYIGMGNISAAVALINHMILRTKSQEQEILKKQRKVLLEQLEAQKLRKGIALLIK